MRPRHFYASFLLPGLLASLNSPMPARGQSLRKPVSPAVVKHDPFLDQVVATVETRKITRGDVARLYIAYYPAALHLDGPLLAAQIHLPAQKQVPGPSHTDLPDLAPKIFGTRSAMQPSARTYADLAAVPTPADVSRVAHCIFRVNDPNLPALARQLMITAALEEAAARRHLSVAASRVRAGVHAVLLTFGAQDIPDISDRKLAAVVGASYDLHYAGVKNELLVHDLTLSDLADQLGHPPAVDDFYSVHMIFLPVALKRPRANELDWEGLQARAEALRAEILAGKRDFEAAATAQSADPTAKYGGDCGPIVRTLLAPAIDQAIQRLKPGEITPPIRYKRFYVLARLDRRGPDLTADERAAALDVCAGAPKRNRNALARLLKDIHWTTALGTPPEWYRRPATD